MKIQNFSTIERTWMVWKAVQRAKLHFPDHSFFAEQVPMMDQVGGHPMWKPGHESIYLLKPMKSDGRGMREVAFYERCHDAIDIHNNPSSLSSKMFSHHISANGVNRIPHLLRALKPFIPDYFGVVDHNSNLFHSFGSQAKIVLKDVTSMYSKKCILDLKLGTQTYEPGASTEKQESQRNKYKEQMEFGFRIDGMRVYDPSHEESDQHGYRNFGKKFGRRLKKRDEVRGALSTYFNLRRHNLRKELVRKIMDRMDGLRRLLDEYNEEMAFYASSILIVFEGDEQVLSLDKFTIKMIDFAHVRYQAKGDPGYRFGLDSIIRFLDEIVSD